MLQINNFRTPQLFNNHPLNLKLDSSHILGILGANGAGKTDFIKSLILPPHHSTGSISLNGSAYFKNEIAYIPSDDPYGSNISIKEAETYNRLRYKKFSTEAFRRYLDRYELDLKMKISKLSLGQKQRLLISLALSSNAALIIMDEPTQGLDPFILREIMDDLRAYVILNEANCIIVTHQTKIYQDFFDHLIYIENHEILFNKSFPDFLGCANSLLNTALDTVNLDDFVKQRQKEMPYVKNY